MNWVAACLVVQAIHLEAPWLQEDAEFRSSFARALQDLALWHGASDLRVAGALPPRLLS